MRGISRIDQLSPLLQDPITTQVPASAGPKASRHAQRQVDAVHASQGQLERAQESETEFQDMAIPRYAEMARERLEALPPET